MLQCISTAQARTKRAPRLWGRGIFPVNLCIKWLLWNLDMRFDCPTFATICAAVLGSGILAVNFRIKIPLVKSWHAFRLRRLAQSGGSGLGSVFLHTSSSSTSSFSSFSLHHHSPPFHPPHYHPHHPHHHPHHHHHHPHHPHHQHHHHQHQHQHHHHHDLLRLLILLHHHHHHYPIILSSYHHHPHHHHHPHYHTLSSHSPTLFGVAGITTLFLFNAGLP